MADALVCVEKPCDRAVRACRCVGRRRSPTPAAHQRPDPWRPCWCRATRRAHRVRGRRPALLPAHQSRRASLPLVGGHSAHRFPRWIPSSRRSRSRRAGSSGAKIHVGIAGPGHRETPRAPRVTKRSRRTPSCSRRASCRAAWQGTHRRDARCAWKNRRGTKRCAAGVIPTCGQWVTARRARDRMVVPTLRSLSTRPAKHVRWHATSRRSSTTRLHSRFAFAHSARWSRWVTHVPWRK